MATLITRRTVVQILGAGITAGIVPLRAQPPRRLFAYVGSWTQGPFGVGGGGGITVFSVDQSTGELTTLSRTGPEFDNLNAGYLCVAPNGRHLYSTNEAKNRDGELGVGGAVLSFAIDPADGSIRHLNTQASMGVNPAYISIDATGSVVAASNHGDYVPAVRVTVEGGTPRIEKVYDDGTVAILPVRPDGTLAPASDVAVLERLSGVDPISQRSPHAHSVNFDPSNRFVIVCDKGADRLYTFRIDTSSGTLTDRKAFTTAPGISPRHSVFHPTLPYVFIVNERESSISVYAFDAESRELDFIQKSPTIPSDFSEPNAPADVRVHPNGQFVYASNRGHDSIAIFRVDQSSGRLELVDRVPTGGSTPRNINLDPSARHLYAANQGSDRITVFDVDARSGSLSPTGATADVLKPACIKFLQV